MRFWLYLGAVLVGFALMAIEDKTAVERTVDQPQAVPSATSEEADVERPAVNGGKQSADLPTMRTVSAELSHRGTTVSAK